MKRRSGAANRVKLTVSLPDFIVADLNKFSDQTQEHPDGVIRRALVYYIRVAQGTLPVKISPEQWEKLDSLGKVKRKPTIEVLQSFVDEAIEAIK